MLYWCRPVTYFQPNLMQLRNALLLGYELAPHVWHWNHWVRDTRHYSLSHCHPQHATVQPERTVATGARDGNKWLDTKSGGSFCGDSPVKYGMYLQLLYLCLRLLALLNIIIQTPCPCFLIHSRIYPSFASWLEESGEICQSLFPSALLINNWIS